MEAPEFLFAIAFLVLLPMFIVRTVVNYKRDRAASESDGASLGTAELEALIRVAVADAIRPLQRQIAELEDRLDDHRPELEIEDEDVRAPEPGRTVGRRQSA